MALWDRGRSPVIQRALTLREGRAPVWDRLLAMVFLAALLHGLIILGLAFNTDSGPKGSAPGLEVLLVSDELPETDRNDSATYLAQRTQAGSGNTEETVAPRNQAAPIPVPKQDGVVDGDALAPKGSAAGNQADRVLTTTAWNTDIRYLADEGNSGTASDKAILLQEQNAERPSLDDEGAAQLRGPKRDELWVTPDTRASDVAPYLAAWRHKVERIGTINYPRAARHANVQRNPVLEVGISSDGKLDRAVIQRSSGNRELDNAALEILKLASPFDPFPPELAREHRMLRFVYEWQFSGGQVHAGGLSTVP